MAQRFAPTGKPVDAHPFTVPTDGSGSLGDVAAGKRTFFVVWRDRRAGHADAYGARIRP